MFSLPIILLSPQDTNYREIRMEKKFTVGILGLEYRPSALESIAGNVGLGINWDPRYIVFEDTDRLSYTEIGTTYKDNKIEADSGSKWSFYINYYLREDSSFYIGLLVNLIRVQLHYSESRAGVYGYSEESDMLDFYANYVTFGAGIGWHCIWENGISLLVGIDFTTNSSSFTKVKHTNDSLLKNDVKSKILEKYEDKHMFPVSSKLMVGFSF